MFTAGYFADDSAVAARRILDAIEAGGEGLPVCGRSEPAEGAGSSSEESERRDLLNAVVERIGASSPGEGRRDELSIGLLRHLAGMPAAGCAWAI